ncbi:MAG: [Fe-Fe] hydrogenase large subunit C-terminal domain-containing protein [Bacteroidales bacterium]
MGVSIEVNNQKIDAQSGEPILNALRRNGIKVPTLCRMEGFTPTGACRMCVVEVAGKNDLVPSCSFPVTDGMKITTHSPRVIKARKMIVELLLSNHPDDCLYCIRNGSCELQNLAGELNVRERRISGVKSMAHLDQSSPGIVRDPGKCILCGRCVRVCDEIQDVATLDFVQRGDTTAIGTAMGKELNFSNCIHCGQCILVCPTGALHEKTNFDIVQEALNNPDLTVAVQYSPSISVSLCNEMEVRTGKDLTGVLNAALRKMGFNRIYNNAFAVDMLAYEQAAELEKRLQEDSQLPLITSDCPGWVKYMEQSHADLIPFMSTCKSPQQMLGTLIKQHLSENEAIHRESVFSVAIMPCTAKKFEAQRPQMMHKGVSDVDAVLTTREIAKLIHLYGIDIHNITPQATNEPFNARSSAAKLAATSGGISEGVLRAFSHRTTGKELRPLKQAKLRSSKTRKEVEVSVGERTLLVVAVSGLKAARRVLDEVRAGELHVDLLEVMACPGGCLSGGGQPLLVQEKDQKARVKTVYTFDEKESMKAAHQNTQMVRYFEEYLGEPMGEKAQQLLHTTYSKREVLK